MNRRIPSLIALFSAGFAGLLSAEEALVDPARPPQSQHGAQQLMDLQSKLIKSFQDSRIEKNYLAAQKMAQLAPEEVTRELLQAAIGSMRTPNMNYRWYLAHLLKKFSGEKHGANQVAWQDWLDSRYTPVKRPVYGRPIPTGPEAGAATEGEVGAAGTNGVTEGSGTMGSGSVGHDTSGGVKKEDMPPSPNLGHDPNDRVVDPTIKKAVETAVDEGAGALTGPGVTGDLPKKPEVSVSDDPRGRSILTTPREDIERERAAREAAEGPAPEGPGDMDPVVTPGN